MGIIDWETAFAGPWEIFGDFPLNLMVVPPAMDAPWNHDEDGTPKDAELLQRLKDQDEYAAAVALEEEKICIEGPRLSRVLRDTKRQHLAAAMRLYADGKPRLYAKVLRQFH